MNPFGAFIESPYLPRSPLYWIDGWKWHAQQLGFVPNLDVLLHVKVSPQTPATQLAVYGNTKGSVRGHAPTWYHLPQEIVIKLGIGDSVELKHSASNLSLVSVAISLITPLALYYNSLNHEVIRTSTGLEADSQENPVNTVGFFEHTFDPECCTLWDHLPCKQISFDIR